MQISRWWCSLLLLPLIARAADKPKLNIDEFFNSVAIAEVKIAPDGQSVVIGTERADWDQNIFRKDLWLYRDDGRGGGSLAQLTQSGHDTEPQWSPDGRWIGFLSERKTTGSAKSDDESAAGEDVAQLFLISPAGGEAFAVTLGAEEVHAFAWSADSKSLYYSTRSPWGRQQKDDYKKLWKDVKQYRGSERGDEIFNIDVSEALKRANNAPSQLQETWKDTPDVTPGSRAVASVPWRAGELAVSGEGSKLAIQTESVSQRQEKIEEFEIYLADLKDAPRERAARRLTKNFAVEHDLRWARDGKHLFFRVEIGDIASYRDLQPHLYWVDAESGDLGQWSKDFGGASSGYDLTNEGVLVAGMTGTETAVYAASKPQEPLHKPGQWNGTYQSLSAAQHSPRIAFVQSSYQKPAEVYLAESVDKLNDARPLTSFNKIFTERDLPQAKPYRWKSVDGTQVEGMLIYPPGKFEARNLPMFVFIHGGPADADGNVFEADWYKWDRLAATAGWLVFQPNYRGSSGYGDKFLMEIVPQLVSRPGKDILAGVDELVKEGVADPNRLAIGGYSYGGYMTNWLITQTTRFKAAVTGAGAVEHVSNWGNDDTTFDDAYFLGGLPWEVAQRYHDEAAIFYMNQVKTPTHIVAGAEDIRVAVSEDYLLDHALHNLGIPSGLLILPGEGHSLKKNPWHGKIKVREELKWLEKYGGVTGN
jgi:dipeptidyl aminopeptidase/acylaminoacyl peptidase